jgi:hypothetical protein
MSSEMSRVTWAAGAGNNTPNLINQLLFTCHINNEQNNNIKIPLESVHH